MNQPRIVLALMCAAIFAQVARAQIAPAAPVPDEAVVAKVDGKKLTAGEVRTALANMPADFSRMYQQNPQLAVQQLFVMRYLGEEAEKLKLAEQSPIKEQLDNMRANILASAMLTHEHNYYGVSEEMMQEFYDRNQAKYQQARIKLLSVAFKPGVPGQGASIADIARATAEAASSKTQRSEAEARALAEDLVKQARGGADFGALIERYSDDAASKAAGGDFGVVNVNSAHAADLKNAVMALKAGEVTDPLRQSNAFLILRVEEKTAQKMNEVIEPIIQELRQVHVNEWFAAIRNRFTVEVENPQFFVQPARPLPPTPLPPAGAK